MITMVMQTFGEQTKSIMGHVEVVNSQLYAFCTTSIHIHDLFVILSQET